jgi:hypothetical protein
LRYLVKQREAGVQSKKRALKMMSALPQKATLIVILACPGAKSDITLGG